MRRIHLTAVLWSCLAAQAARGGEVNLLVNPDFQETYAAGRLADPLLPGVRPEHRRLPGYGGEAFLPYGWSIVPQQHGQGVVALVQDDGKPAMRLQTKDGESLLLQQRLVEVIPGATYGCGLWIKGSGRAHLKVRVSDPAAAESLVELPIAATPDWKLHRKTGLVGWHRHLAVYELRITGPADLLIRGAEVSTPGGSLAPPGAAPAGKDADTLFHEGFDGATTAITPGGAARLTETNGGRFGRGLATSSAGGGLTANLAIGELPEKGTLEFWFKPAVLPVHPGDNYRTILALATQSRTSGSGTLQFANSGNMRGSMMLAFSLGRSARTHTMAQAYTTDGGWGWWQPGTWHHLAGSWDGEALRFYVDGVLSGISHVPGLTLPQGTVVSVTLPYDGVIDELRLSKGLRYGPVIPAGFQPVPFNPPAAPKADTADAVRELTVAELDEARGRETNPVPECKADYVIGIDQMHPAWEGMPGLTPIKDYFGTGADGLEVNGEGQVGRAAYCRIGALEAGNYYVGLWVESGSRTFRTEYAPSRLLVSAYVNGWPLRFETTTEPVQVRPGLWLCELQTAAPVALKAGDEIAFCPMSFSEGQRVLRLALYRKEPDRGHGITGRTFGLEGKTPQRLRLVIQPELQGSGEDGTAHTASIRIANPLPYAVETEVTWSLADYFGAPVEQKTETVHIEPHRVWTMARPFTAQGDARAYQLDVRTRAAPGFTIPHSRPVEWLDLNDYTRIEFMPHQPGPLDAWMHVRKDLVDNRTGSPKSTCLDGNRWEFAFLEGRRVPDGVPADLKFTPCTLPVVQGLPKNRFGIWYRTTFRVPEWLRGQNVRLDLYGGVEETLFLNGRRVGQGLSRVQEHGALGRLHLPSADLNQALRPDAENELVICVRGGVALMSADFVDQYDPSDWNSTRENQERQGTRFTTVGLHDLWLSAAPPLRVRQSLVVPDVEKGLLRIFTRVENESDQPRQVELQFQVFQKGVQVKAPIPAQAVTVEPRSVKQVMVDAPAGDLVPYTLRSPVLARLSTLAVENGATVDRFDQRFGYRAFQVRGTGMLWNGKPVKFLGAVFRGRDEVFEGEDGVDIVRSSHDLPTWLAQRNLYDEIGYLIYPGPGVALNEAAWKKLNNQTYWDDARRGVIETVWDVGSHPCVAGWNMSNESYHYAPYLSGKEAQDKLGERIFEVVQAVRKDIWPGFWFLADGDENLGDRLDFCSFHYLNHGARTYDFRARPQLGAGDPPSPGISHFSPDSFYLNGAADIPRKGTVVSQNPDWVYGSSACGDTESFGKGGGVHSREMGDRAAFSAACQWYVPRGVAWNKMALDAYRDMEAFTSGMYWESALGVFAPDVTFSLPQQAVRYYSGARFDRRLNIHDDAYAPGDLEFRWTFADGAGKCLNGDTLKLRSTTAFLERRRIAFDVPTVTRRTRYTLAMELLKDGRRMAREERHVEVWPALSGVEGPCFAKATQGKPALPIVVFDPAGTVSPLLANLGYAARTITALDKAALAGAQRLVIAPDSVTKAPAPWRDALQEYTRQGGRVLILHQEDASLLPADITIEKRIWTSQGFVCAQDHPVMQGLKDLDFWMWNPDHLIAKGAFRKPARGNVITLVDSSHLDRASKTPTWSEVIELHLGAGSIVAVQLPLVERFGTEPMAAEMFKRLLAYLGQPVCRTIDRRLAVLGRPSEAVVQRLHAARVDHEILNKPDTAWPVTLLDLNGGPVPADVQALRAYVEHGGTLLVHRVRPEQAAWLEALTGKPVTVRIQPYQMWADRQVLERRGGLLDGLNNLDFYWRSPVGGEGADSLLQVSSGVAKGRELGQVLYRVEVAGVPDRLFPGGLVEVPVGKGRVIVDQLKWEAPGEGLDGGNPLRVLSVLLTNLGIVQKPPAPKPTLPPDVTREPIDLTPVVNLGLVDAKAGDGVGWADWGPEQDLRDFPTGTINLGGVPFRVTPGTNNGVALRAGKTRLRSLAAYPTSVTIPVNRKNVAGLWFLHTGGWMYGANAYAWREVRYTDGTQAVMPLNESNTGDWNMGREEFPIEEDTTTTVAWQGACRMYPLTRVYKTLWVNPHPDKPVKEVVLTTRDLPDAQLRFLVHLGVTAAILPEGSTPRPAQRDSRKSETLLQEALKLMAEKKPAEAAARLEAALQADDQNTAAWKELAALTVATAEPAALPALCQKWIQAMPDSYEAHNVLGQFLEKEGQLTEALAEYQKSLVLEWNQPQTGEAARRVEALRVRKAGENRKPVDAR